MTRKTKILPLIFMIFLIFISGFTVFGCASVVSKELLRGVDRTLSPATLQAASDASGYKGRRVVWGGVILGLEHTKTSTVVEVFSTTLDSTLRPTGRVSESFGGGRFLVESSGFLDEVIYSKGSGITVVGIVEGIRKKKIDEMEYPYPVLSPIEIHIFDMTVREYPDPYMSPYMWGPPYYPYGAYGGYYGGPYYWPYNSGYWPGYGHYYPYP